jgi:hypothetical protein
MTVFRECMICSCKDGSYPRVRKKEKVHCLCKWDLGPKHDCKPNLTALSSRATFPCIVALFSRLPNFTVQMAFRFSRTPMMKEMMGNFGFNLIYLLANKKPELRPNDELDTSSKSKVAYASQFHPNYLDY